MTTIPVTLFEAIRARPASERPRLIGEWALTLRENEARAERIREQIERGFIIYHGESGEGS
jgi:hypothetical protein